MRTDRARMSHQYVRMSSSVELGPQHPHPDTCRPTGTSRRFPSLGQKDSAAPLPVDYDRGTQIWHRDEMRAISQARNTGHRPDGPFIYRDELRHCHVNRAEAFCAMHRSWVAGESRSVKRFVEEVYSMR